ncbi:FtsX-like permease family protein [Actinomadura luteofluorescens]|uniref:FtsX-like permease family protein n=1 Tax=Actinomadura luteofluorescens TaxID=46163 RepID=UPI003641EDB2
MRIEPVSTYVAQASQAEKEDSHLANVVILGIVMAYALLALVNTLVTSVSARRREMGALSLTGATHRQIVGIVVSEAVLAVAVGTLVSILSAGAVLGLQHVTLSRVIDHPPLALPWADFLQIVTLCTATAALAAIVATAHPRTLRGRTHERVNAPVARKGGPCGTRGLSADADRAPISFARRARL